MGDLIKLYDETMMDFLDSKDDPEKLEDWMERNKDKYDEETDTFSW